MAASEWSEKTRILITIGVGVAANIGLGFWLYTAYDKFTLLEKQGVEKKKEKAKLDAVVSGKEKLENDLKQKKASLKKKESQLPELSEVEQLITSISSIAQDSGATLLSYARAATPVVEGSYEKTTYRTRWQADFMSWCKLMNSMEENFRRFVAFENLNLTPPSAGMVLMGAKHEISVDVVVYRYVRQQ